jgi:hypothetical protein
MEKMIYPDEIRLRLGDPLIRDRTINTSIKLTRSNGVSATSKASHELVERELHCGSIYLNFPIALTGGYSSSSDRNAVRLWNKINPKDKDKIVGVLLSENFENSDIYFILFD